MASFSIFFAKGQYSAHSEIMNISCSDCDTSDSDLVVKITAPFELRCQDIKSASDLANVAIMS